MPQGTKVLPAETVEAFRVTGSDATVTAVDVAGQPFAKALRCETRRRPPTTYAAQLRAVTVAPVQKDDALLATFYARAVASKSETGEALTEFIFERAGGDYEKSVEFAVSVGAQWKKFNVPFRARDTYAAGGAQVCFRLGYDPQTIEIGGIEAINFGKQVALKDLPGYAQSGASYPGREPDAAWRKTALERIERIRKADLTVTVTDASGKPVKDAQVAVKMRRHAFGFGSAVALARVTDQGPDGEKYREVIAQYFNKVVTENDLKWPPWENQQNRQRTLNGLAWLRSKGVTVRGHVLVWPGWRNVPQDVRALEKDPAALRKRVNDHITEEVSALRGTIAEWDVINETMSNFDLLNVLGKEAMVEWFKVARQADLSVKLFYNDYTMLSGGARPDRNEHLFRTLQYLVDNGAPMDGIGEQAHFGGAVTPPERALQILDRFAAFKLPIQITEFDVDTTDESLQADYTRDFMIAAFSHPSVIGVLMWGFWEGQHWKPNAALWRRDWALKPNGQVWINLVTKHWWTNATGASNAQGVYQTRGFLGDYEVSVTAGNKTKTTQIMLTKEGKAVKVVMD